MRFIYFICLFLLLGCGVVFSQDAKELEPILPSDRILILAPHPDDETIGCAGVIQAALKKHAEVKVVILTNGDSNEFAFIAYEKRLTFKREEFLHMGEVRYHESIASLRFLGLPEKNIVALGYPDSGTGDILTKTWDDQKPYLSLLSRVRNVPYKEALSFGAPYTGNSIIKDLRSTIADFKPTKIFVTSPVETNRDHRALYVFLRLALWDLEGKIPEPKVLPYIIHVVGWPMPRGYHPDLELAPFYKFKYSDVSWQKYSLNDQEIQKKHDAIMLFKSQNEPNSSYLLTFARRNELFGDYPPIHLNDNKCRVVWSEVGVKDRIIKNLQTGKLEKLSSLSYSLSGKYLYMRVIMKKSLYKNFGLNIYLLGYKQGVDFAKMPKLHLFTGVGGLSIHNKDKTIFVKDAEFSFHNRKMIFRIPLIAMGDPDRVMVYSKAVFGDLPLDKTAWRILLLGDNKQTHYAS
jgi:LmbE family N-acetylglucosaminyl deacetylase